MPHDTPLDAGGQYRKPKDLLKFLATQPQDYIIRTESWLREHYTHTDDLCRRVRALIK